jgi:hypothetical protein
MTTIIQLKLILQFTSTGKFYGHISSIELVPLSKQMNFCADVLNVEKRSDMSASGIKYDHFFGQMEFVG